MLARHEGQVTLVSGAIPGERVRVQVERAAAHVMWARTVDVIEPSPDRLEPLCDAACGGLSYAHIAYPRQCALKSEIVSDAFRRVGRMTLETPVEVVPSESQAYRMRARLHVQEGRFGFFREHSHVLCDAASTAQLRAESLAAVADVVSRLGPDLARCQAVIVSENLAGSQRILHLESSDEKPVMAVHLGGRLPAGVTGLATWVDGGVHVLAGDGRVTDSALELFPDAGRRPVPEGTLWSRAGAAFFQGNRYLIGPLTGRVLEHARGTVADLYAGVGLFAIGLSARGHRVLAIENDRVSAADLAFNAERQPDLEVHRGAVEHTVRRLRPGAFDTVILDPPRSGLSREAMAGILTLEARRIVFVSCDIATFARDAGRLVAQGYRMHGLEAFDMFPNTGHVETIAVFDRGIT